MQLRVSTTIDSLCELYLERHAKPHKGTWKEDERRIKLYIKPALGRYLAHDVKRSHVAELHAEIGKTKPYQANRVREQLSKMFELARLWGYLPDTASNPARGIKDFKERDRARFLSQDEAKRVYAGIESEPDVYVRAALLLILCTGLRKGEVLALEWRNVNLNEGYCRVEDTKNGDTVFQPLSQPAKTILSLLPRRDSNPYVICGLIEGKPRNTITKAWNRIRKRADVEDVTIHDLRRTVGSWLAQEGCPIQTIKEVMNHKNLKTTLIYARVNSEVKKEALEFHGDRLARMIG